jgi:hypothetical protein
LHWRDTGAAHRRGNTCLASCGDPSSEACNDQSSGGDKTEFAHEKLLRSRWNRTAMRFRMGSCYFGRSACDVMAITKRRFAPKSFDLFLHSDGSSHLGGAPTDTFARARFTLRVGHHSLCIRIETIVVCQNQWVQLRIFSGPIASPKSDARESLMQPVRLHEAVERRSRAEGQQQYQKQCRDCHAPPICCPWSIQCW